MLTSEQKGHAAETSGDGYMPVYLRTLEENTVLDFNLYIRTPAENTPTLYRQASLPFQRTATERLLEGDIDFLWVRQDERVRYRHYVERHLEHILADISIPLEVRTGLLYESCQELVKDILRAPHSGELMKRSGLAVQHIVHHLYGNHEAFACLAQLTWNNYETYTHCVDVCVFATALAIRLGYDKEKILQICQGALLHDVGKCMIDPAILKKEGPLTPGEWTIIRQHPTEGEHILRENGISSRIILDIVRHHHERLTGDGYPDKLPAKGITPWVRIVTIADIFSALTAQRSFGPRMRSFEALQLMREEMGGFLDQHFLREFIKLLAIR